MAINKVEANGQTLIDLTNDTAEAEDVLEGQTFHLRSGAIATGTYKPSAEIEARLRATVGHSSKNLLEITEETQTINGVTFTVDKQAGTVTATRESASSSDAILAIEIPDEVKGQNLYFSGCPSKGSAITYNVYVLDYTANSRAPQWDGATLSVTDYGTSNNEVRFVEGHRAQIRLRIKAEYDAQNIVFKPMLRDGSISDDTFEPYVTPTDERIIALEARVAALEAIINNR